MEEGNGNHPVVQGPSGCREMISFHGFSLQERFPRTFMHDLQVSDAVHEGILPSYGSVAE
jgi:hypothetical protein